MPGQKLSNASKDNKYFVITPQLVWWLSRDPYDYTLWCVIKMIAGDEGECYMSTEHLAIMAMMSTGKVSTCRRYLLEQSLLEGELRQDPGYPQPVWHLTIPNIWKRNIEWREKYDAMTDRLDGKSQQKNSLHTVKASPGEERLPPGEERLPPGETKNNHANNQEGKPNHGASAQDDVFRARVSMTTTPARRTLRAKFHHSVQGDGKRPPEKFPNADVAERFDKAAARLNSSLESAIDAALGQGLTTIMRIVNYIAKYENGGKSHDRTESQRVPGRIPAYSVADPAAFHDQRPDDEK